MCQTLCKVPINGSSATPGGDRPGDRATCLRESFRVPHELQFGTQGSEGHLEGPSHLTVLIRKMGVMLAMNICSGEVS